jgi:enamine deaminase RidA (YjgF/YER057c/UK114 family)
LKLTSGSLDQSTVLGFLFSIKISNMTPEQRVLELGVQLPSGSGTAGNYAAAVRSENLLYLSGKAPLAVNGEKPKGRIGGEYSAEDGYLLARSACMDLLAAIRNELGSLDNVAHVLELHGALSTTPEFEDHARVLDGASDLLVEVFGAAGVHARSVIGVASLRNGVPLTVRATVRCVPD